MTSSRTSNVISYGLLLFAMILFAAQFIQQVSSDGAWCKPSLDAPNEQGFYSHQFTSYGFPLSFVTVVKEECFSESSITYEWFPPGILVDMLLPGIVLYVWLRLRQRTMIHEAKQEEK